VATLRVARACDFFTRSERPWTLLHRSAKWSSWIVHGVSGAASHRQLLAQVPEHFLRDREVMPRVHGAEARPLREVERPEDLVRHEDPRTRRARVETAPERAQILDETLGPLAGRADLDVTRRDDHARRFRLSARQRTSREDFESALVLLRVRNDEQPRPAEQIDQISQHQFVGKRQVAGVLESRPARHGCGPNRDRIGVRAKKSNDVVGRSRERVEFLIGVER